MAAPGFFLIQAVEFDLSVRCGHGDGAVIPSGGYGGWQIVQRKQRVGVTEWQGVDPMQWDVPFLLDGYHARGHTDELISQNDKMYRLELLAAPQNVSKRDVEITTTPPVVNVFGPPGLILNDLDLVIADLQWDRELMILDNIYENYLRAGGTITFMKYIRDRHLAHLDAATQNRLGKKKKAKHKTHRVAHGETLKDIAKEELGDASRYKEIMDVNKIRDPRSIHVGQLLKMP